MEEKKLVVKDEDGYEHEYDVRTYLSMSFVDNRLLSVYELMDGRYCLFVENPESEEREKMQYLLLTKTSFFALTSLLFTFNKNMDWPKIMNEIVDGKSDYAFFGIDDPFKTSENVI